MANKIQLERNGNEEVHIASFGASTQNIRHFDTATVWLHTDIGEKIPINVLVVPTIAVPLCNLQKTVSSLSYLQGLKLAHPSTDKENLEIELLIGVDYYWNIVQNRFIRGNGPTAVQSKIGYLLSGPLTMKSNQSNGSIFNVIASPTEFFDLQRFWDLESIGISTPKNENLVASHIQEFQDTSIEFEDGRHSAKLPWKDDHPPLPDNYNVARRRTQNTIQRLQEQPSLFHKYGEILADQEKHGFIEKVDPAQPVQNVHYIPHCGVTKDSATTPVRIVYDCSCRQSRDAPSLNDCLKSIPPDLNDLTSILIRFRLNPFAVSTDIEKAFLHVQLDEKDRDFTRFLCLSDPNDPNSELITYRFKAILFGATCSPFILNATLLKHLNDNGEVWVSDKLKQDLYVDNIISSFSTEAQAISYFRETRDLMSAAGFNLRSWNSNSQKLRELASDDDVLDADRLTKVLGISWDAGKDELFLRHNPIQKNNVTTKRDILQQTSKVYDPLGLISPVTIRAKILLQELWQQKYDWDAPLPQNIQQRWHEIADDLNSVSSQRFQRRYFFNLTETDETILLVFADASPRAYDACAYLCRNGVSTLVMSKTRVAPLKALTLPRLELMAAVLGARLGRHILDSIHVETMFLWTDSQIVLHWLQTSRPLKTFTANRVREIHDLTENRKWRYCPTSVNPADLLTRGITSR